MSRSDAASAVRMLAGFRYELRRFLRFSEQAVRAYGVTPLQHQLLLGVAGFTERPYATVSELAEFLQQRHNAVVSLLDRAVDRGLVRRERSAADRRCVRVRLTRLGAGLLQRLSRLHLAELSGIESRLPRGSVNRRRTIDVHRQSP